MVQIKLSVLFILSAAAIAPVVAVPLPVPTLTTPPPSAPRPPPPSPPSRPENPLLKNHGAVTSTHPTNPSPAGFKLHAPKPKLGYLSQQRDKTHSNLDPVPVTEGGSSAARKDGKDQGKDDKKKPSKSQIYEERLEREAARKGSIAPFPTLLHPYPHDQGTMTDKQDHWHAPGEIRDFPPLSHPYPQSAKSSTQGHGSTTP